MAASANLEGPYRLNFDGVSAIRNGSSPGVIALGYIGPDAAFYINFVGRSDHDVKSRLLELIGSDSMFKLGLTASPEEAFRRECELFHSFRPPANRVHPGRPSNTSWVCPRCSLMDGWW
jgi:hypothetical protein